MPKAYARLFLTALLAVIVPGCSGGADTTIVQTPPDTDLDWDNGNWDEEDWQ